MLSMFSHPGRSSPTERGVALMDIFLCEPTPTPPNNVDFSIVNNTNGPLKTVRERLLAHATNSVCASCHTHSDPIGLSLEDFDTIGGYRTKENGQTIDVSATLQGKSFVGAQGLGRFLHDNPKYPACIARKLYSYAKGVNSEDVEPAGVQGGLQGFQRFRIPYAQPAEEHGGCRGFLQCVGASGARQRHQAGLAIGRGRRMS